MKLAYIVQDYNRVEGHSRYVVELAIRYAQTNEVHVFANTIQGERPDNIHFHHVPAWRKNALTTVLSFIPGIALTLRQQFDVIHTQGLCSFRNSVITAHQCNRKWHASRRRVEGTVGWRERTFGAVVSPLEHLLYRTAGKSHVIAVSRRIAEDLRESYKCKSPMHVIYHGVDLATFRPGNRQQYRADIRSSLGLRADEYMFLFVGDLRKGARQCIRALASVPEARLVLVSRSEPLEYIELARAAGTIDRVIFAGPSSCVEQYYACADAFVLPTPYDPFALVVTEAMACGLPVIVSREAGAAELVEHGVNGLILEDVTSVAELTGHMRCLCEKPEKGVEMGRIARKTVEPMSWDAVAERTMRVYQEAIAEHNG